MNNLPTKDDSSDSDFEEDLPSIDGAIIDNSGEISIKPLAKTEIAGQVKAAVQAPKAASVTQQATAPRPIEPQAEPHAEPMSSSTVKPVGKAKTAKSNPVSSSKIENLLDDIISQGQTKPREDFALDQGDIEQAMENLDSLEVERGEFIAEESSIEASSTTSANEANLEEEERVDSLEIESMLSELESFENRQSGKNTGALKPQQSSAAETNNEAEPQRARNTSAFTESEVQRMLQELAAIEAREEESEERKAAQNQQHLNRITREIKPVAPASQIESGKHKIPQNLHRAAPPTYQPRASYGAAASADQRRDRRSLFITAAVLCFCAIAITAGLIYERKNTRLRIEQSLTASRTASGGQQFSKTNFELLDLVRKAPSKSSGSTIDQEITNTLNRKHGRNWQPVGWKLDQESGENSASTVKFIWSERGVNKEAVWRIEASTRKITAANEDASFFTR